MLKGVAGVRRQSLCWPPAKLRANAMNCPDMLHPRRRRATTGLPRWAATQQLGLPGPTQGQHMPWLRLIAVKNVAGAADNTRWQGCWKTPGAVGLCQTTRAVCSPTWCRCHWQALHRSTVPFLEQACLSQSHALCLVDPLLDVQHTVVVRFQPAMVHRGFELLVNHMYIHMCDDGTCRMVRTEWVLMTLGGLAQHAMETSRTADRSATHLPVVDGQSCVLCATKRAL